MTETPQKLPGELADPHTSRFDPSTLPAVTLGFFGTTEMLAANAPVIAPHGRHNLTEVCINTGWVHTTAAEGEEWYGLPPVDG